MHLVLTGQTCKMLGFCLSWDTGWGFLGPTEFPKCLAPNYLRDWVCCIGCAVHNPAELCVKWAHFQWQHILTSCFLFLFCFFLFLPSQSPLPMEPVQRPGATSPLVCFHLFLCPSFILALFLFLLFLSFFFCTSTSVALMPWRILRENQNKPLF